MRKLVVGTFLTLDGVMQAPGGPNEDREGGFQHGGWLVPYFDERIVEIMTEWNLGGRTSSVDQNSPDGSGGGLSAADGGLGVRRAFWWLEDKNLGRVSVGRRACRYPIRGRLRRH